MCGGCETRTYCSKNCQILDWKMGGHKRWCKTIKRQSTSIPTTDNRSNTGQHEPWCAYLCRNPELDNDCLVPSCNINSNPKVLTTTGMNTGIFLVVKTKTELVGWQASSQSFDIHAFKLHAIRKRFQAIAKSDFVSGFIVPGEDRVEGTLDLKPTCRTMRVMVWTDPTQSRRQIMEFVQAFEWFSQIEIMAPVKSYKDFVVFDMAHKKPYSFSDVALFNQGCTFDGATDF